MTDAVTKDQSWAFVIEHIAEKKDESTSEAVCNGIWTEILRRHFSYPDFIIAPEQRQTTGKRPDLTIFYVDKKRDLSSWHPIFTFEGKAPYHEEYMVNKGLEQASGYLKTLSWSNRREKMTYGMLACGKSFMILKYDLVQEKLFRIDPSDQEEKADAKTSSLDTQAQGFDLFCKNFAASFL
ncbi:hypothetical protein HYE68_008752 [Fusarium pseudograminearum]|uniref:Fungal-type protein kinase domain-containing protein n=1 Tax=Fusarium pseudograminearum (strain CS3096) TaxID=1028729 RepID=K3VU58_FUSPC|nr:hypothetical protein FPSE_00730 [Fusarium pseudograminearum CS3096]EKJ79129.1 hypothetical protein FPSE_00730 [Fusarium pseudograminearum CS3096]QPC78000.1 hypothetical protein HYE68_008752 [Fusarium pseudograminearum]